MFWSAVVPLFRSVVGVGLACHLVRVLEHGVVGRGTYPVGKGLGAGDNVRVAASPEAAPSAIAIDARGPAVDGGGEGSEGSEEGGRDDGVDRGDELHIWGAGLVLDDLKEGMVEFFLYTDRGYE